MNALNCIRSVVLCLLVFLVSCSRPKNEDQPINTLGTKVASQSGLGFQVPDSFSVEETDGPVRLIEIADSSAEQRGQIRILVYKAQPPDAIHTLATEAFVNSARKRGGDVLEPQGIQKEIMGGMRQGTRFESAATGRTEFFTFQDSGQLFQAIVQFTTNASTAQYQVVDQVLKSMHRP